MSLNLQHMFNCSKTSNNPKYAVITLLVDSLCKVIDSFQQTIFPKSTLKKIKKCCKSFYQLSDRGVVGKTTVIFFFFYTRLCVHSKLMDFSGILFYLFIFPSSALCKARTLCLVRESISHLFSLIRVCSSCELKMCVMQ